MRLLLYNIEYGTGRLRRFAFLELFRHTTRHFPNVGRLVELAEPDLIGLVEVDSGSYRMRSKNQAEELGRQFHYHSCHRVKYPAHGLLRHLPILRKQSNAVLSRLPILNTTYHDFETGVKSLAIEVETERFNFFLVHLALGLHARHRQLIELRDLVSGKGKPVIVGGDFNALTGSGELSQFLRESGLRSMNALHRPTFPSWRPRKELDFICYSEGIRPIRFRIPKVRISDHLPLLADFDIE